MKKIIIFAIFFISCVSAEEIKWHDKIKSSYGPEGLYLRCLSNAKNKRLDHMKYLYFASKYSVLINWTGNYWEYSAWLYQNEKRYLILDGVKDNVIIISKETGRLWNNKDKDWLEKNRYLSCSEIEESDLPN